MPSKCKSAAVKDRWLNGVCKIQFLSDEIDLHLVRDDAGNGE
jgi:hypothetical protein